MVQCCEMPLSKEKGGTTGEVTCQGRLSNVRPGRQSQRKLLQCVFLKCHLLCEGEQTVLALH